MIAQKHFQKLLGKKKHKSPVKPSYNESVDNKAYQTIVDNIVKDPLISCKNSQVNLKNVINEIPNQSESKEETSKNEDKE